MHNPRYPLDLFCRVITVSLETMEIVNGKMAVSSWEIQPSVIP